MFSRLDTAHNDLKICTRSGQDVWRFRAILGWIPNTTTLDMYRLQVVQRFAVQLGIHNCT